MGKLYGNTARREKVWDSDAENKIVVRYTYTKIQIDIMSASVR